MTTRSGPDTFTHERYLDSGNPVYVDGDTVAETYKYIGNLVITHSLLLIASTPDTEASDFSSTNANASVNVDATHRYIRALRWRKVVGSSEGAYIRSARVYGGSPIPKGAPYNATAGNIGLHLHKGTASTPNTTPIASATPSVVSSALLPFVSELTLVDSMHFLSPTNDSTVFFRLLNSSGATLNAGVLYVDMEIVLL